MANHVITDGIWDGDKISQCSYMAHLHFPFLYLYSDDWACFEINIPRIRSHIYYRMPKVTETQIRGWLDEYYDNGLLFRWADSGKEYGYWTGEDQLYDDAQSGRLWPVSRRNKRTTPPPTDDLHLYLGVNAIRTETYESVPLGEGQGEGNRRRKEELQSKINREFEVLWSLYPRKREKRKSLNAYIARRNEGIDAGVLLVAVKNYAASCIEAKREPEFIKLGSSFFSGRDRCFEDWVDGNPEKEPYCTLDDGTKVWTRKEADKLLDDGKATGEGGHWRRL